jgi:hypothetical protein
MKKAVSVLLILFLGLFLYSCIHGNSGRSEKSNKNATGQNIDLKYDSSNFYDLKQGTDSMDLYQPDRRDLQNIFDGVFDIPEIYVVPSPATVSSVVLKKQEKIIDLDVSPAGLIVAVLTSDSTDNDRLKFWSIGQNDFFDEVIFPSGFRVKSVVWHPLANAIFITGTDGEQYHILRLEKEIPGWRSESIFSTNLELNRLVVCPRPFVISYDYKLKKSIFSYRIFFGLQNEDNSYRIASVTEYGKRFYQVIGPSATFTHSVDEDVDPSRMESDWALPLSFSPSGRELIWNDARNNFFVADYESRYWGNFKPLLNGILKGGTITPTPNGLGLIHWQKEKSGIGIYMIAKKTEDSFAAGYEFLKAPSALPDGNGIVGIIKISDCYSLNYIPIKFPQSDVVNAWMFSENQNDISLFTKNYGLFRTLSDDQLYQLYESENYYCNSYDQTTPTRPYLITTDICWELFGSAFQGIFTIGERKHAIPAFWNFINAADGYLNKSVKPSPWTPVFDALAALHKKDANNPETNRILNAGAKTYSNTLKKEFDYSQLKPRGFYTSTVQMQEYFRAFKYLTTVFETDKKIIDQLNTFPPEIKKYADDWINSYKGFISPSRRPNVFDLSKVEVPPYVQYPDTGLSIFPLSWGFDNEALNSTVYHMAYPADKQIISTRGELRLLPSGLDLAAALSNDFASALLEEQYIKYPNLHKVIDSLRKNFLINGKIDNNSSLYDRWITVLSTQWTDTVHSTNGNSGNEIWQTKRLQTGLASWATLRHATVLVNETGAAECGEGGFEEILMRAPRGYVEPDPDTFGAIADLFEACIAFVPKFTSSDHDISDSGTESYKTLYDGITKRLEDAAKSIRKFQTIALKERRGETLSDDDYEEILYVGRLAEHYFLIFKSLANEEYALAAPDPMPKITNVFGIPETDFLMAAVGRPLEWDFTVPFYGRHEIVKGSVYSYYEFYSDKLLNDKEWINILETHPFLPWIKPFVSEQKLSYPPQSGF